MTTAPTAPKGLVLGSRLQRLRLPFLIVSSVLACAAASCQNTPVRAVQMNVVLSAQAATDLSDHVVWDGQLIFADSAASGEIQVFLDPQGGFVVADGGQSQVRIYTDSAQLVWSAGRSGPGPSEFQRLTSAVRTRDRDVIALDSRGKLVMFDSTGVFKRTVTTGLTLAYNSWLLNDSTLLISGRHVDDPDSPLLHVWDVNREQIRRSFFTTPPHDSEFDQAYRFSGWAYATAAGGDTLAVVFPLSDTLYLYRTDGTPLSKFKLPLDRFQRMREPRARGNTPEARIEWRNSYTRIARVHSVADGSLLVQYFNLRGLEPVWGISRVFINRGSLHKSFDVTPADELLGVSKRSARLYFLRSDNLESTEWSIAHLLP